MMTGLFDYTVLRALVAQHPDRGSLPITLILAICMAESSFRTYAIRYEPQYRWLYGEPTTLAIPELLGQKHSWGLMQVMGAVAREYGHTGPFTDLWDPPVGLRYGLLHLRRLRDRYPEWTDVIAAYNAGSPRKQQNRYVNQPYVHKVMDLWARYDRKEAGEEIG